MKFFTIFTKEYLQIVKKKSFLISTLLTPVIMALFIYLPVLLQKTGREEKKIIFVDLSGIVQKGFKETVINGKEAKKLKLTINIKEGIQNKNELYTKDKNGKIELTSQYKKMIIDKEIEGILIVPPDIKEKRVVYYFSRNISDLIANEFFMKNIKNILLNAILIEQNVPIEVINNAVREIKGNLYVVKEKGSQKSNSKTAYMLSVILLSILMSVIMGYGQLIMRGIMEEKNSRIAELLVSCTTPKNIFYGKIFGIGCAGITQVGIWGLMIIAFMFQSFFVVGVSALSFFSSSIFTYFAIFFTLGYFMYAVFFSMVGASVNTDEEAQQFAAPVIYMLLIPFFIGIIATSNPDSLLVTLCSFFPPFTPMLMFMRITVSPPAMWQIITSIVLCSVFILFVGWLGSKIFRTGLLMYGKKPSVKEIIKWIKYK